MPITKSARVMLKVTPIAGYPPNFFLRFASFMIKAKYRETFVGFKVCYDGNKKGLPNSGGPFI
jgi:hypothetical protein